MIIVMDVPTIEVISKQQQIIIKIEQQMGSGCFKPPTAPTSLDLSAIESIYEDVRQLNPPSSSSYQQSLQAYQQVSQRIAQRGRLKKLCDYLSSHRHRISETVMHSYRLVYQSKNCLYKYVGIIVMDAVLNIGPKAKDRAKRKQGQLEVSMVEHNSSRAATVLSSGRESAVQNLVDSETTRKRTTEPSQMQATKMQTNASQNFSHQLSSPKLESIYFNLIILLIQQNDLLFRLCLQNMIKYCQLYQEQQSLTSAINVNLNSNKFNNKAQIDQIMKVIFYHIRVNNQLGISLKCYKAMLHKMRDSYFSANTEYLDGLFDLWLGIDQAGTDFHDGGHNYEGNSSSNKSISTEDNQMSPQELSQLVVDILQIFLSRCIEEYQSSRVIEEVFKVLDKQKYRKVTKIQNLLIDTLSSNELKNQFNKSLILYLLAYIGFPNCPTKDPTNEYSSSILRQQSRILSQIQAEDGLGNMHVLEKQWVDCYKIGMPGAFGRLYRNVREAQCKGNSIAKINKWLFQYQLVDIEDLLAYSPMCLLNAFVFNLYSQDKKVKDKTIIELSTFINQLTQYSFQQTHKKGHPQQKLLNNSLKLQLGVLIMTQIQQNRIYDENVRYTLLTIWENCLEKQKQLILDYKHSHLISGLSVAYCFENNVKMIQIMGKVFEKIHRDSLKVHLERVCEFYDSLFREIVVGFSNAKQKIVLIQQFGNTFGANASSDKLGTLYRGIHAAFLQKINSSLAKKGKKQGLIQQNCIFFADYLAYTVSKILGLGIRNKNIQDYNQKISTSTDNHQLQILQKYSTDRIPIQLDISHRDQLEFYKDSSEYFRVRPTNEYEMGATASILWKGAQSVLERSLSGDSVYTKADKDLEEVLDIIRF